MKKTIEQIAQEDGRYDIKALKFVFDGLGETIREIREESECDSGTRHITGAELARGIASLARQRWGFLANMVLNRWGVSTTRDMGEIVYLMIKHNWMTAQETDRIEDFDDVYDFCEVFEKRFRFEMN